METVSVSQVGGEKKDLWLDLGLLYHQTCLLKGQEGRRIKGMDENIVEVMDH